MFMNPKRVIPTKYWRRTIPTTIHNLHNETWIFGKIINQSLQKFQVVYNLQLDIDDTMEN